MNELTVIELESWEIDELELVYISQVVLVDIWNESPKERYDRIAEDVKWTLERKKA